MTEMREETSDLGFLERRLGSTTRCVFKGGDITEGCLPNELSDSDALPNLLFLNLDAMSNLFNFHLEALSRGYLSWIRLLSMKFTLSILN